MKKYINNKSYDTDKATAIGSYDNGNSGFDSITETLYRKRTGEYFLHGEGGARTVYGESRGNNSWVGGESIVPLTVDAAAQWAEQHLSADAYAEIFGEAMEDDTKKLVSINVTTTAHEKGKRAAAAAGVSLSSLISDYLDGL